MQITYVGPFDAVDIVVALDEFNEPVWLTAERDQPIDVDPTVAGRPPSSDYVDAHAAIAVLHPLLTAPDLADEDRAAAQKAIADAHNVRVAADPGEGLLAQADNWQPVQATKDRPAMTKAEKAAAAELERKQLAELAALEALSDEDRAALAGLSDDERAALKEGDTK